MRFEKITENKLRITFSLEDLSENNIDFHSFMANSDETQALFLDMLEKAEKEIGFVTKDYKLMVEVLATSDGHFILTVTRSLPEHLKNAPRKLKGKKKGLTIFNNSAIYCFNDFEDICNACATLDDSFIKLVNKSLHKSKLYLLNNKYYLVLNIITNNEHIKKLYCLLSEFSNSYQTYSSTFETRLIEYGKVIIENKTFTKINKYFKTVN